MNSSEDINNLVRYTEELACHLNPGPAAVKIGEHLNERYILINKDNLPKLNFGSIDDAYSGTIGGFQYITEKTFSGNTKKMRDMALELLSMAEHLDVKRKTEEDTKLKKARYNAYLLLFPESTTVFDEFDFDGTKVSTSTRNAITQILKLQAQLDDAQGKR